MKKLYIYFIILTFSSLNLSFSQDCQSTLIFKLSDVKTGRFFSNQTVTMTSMSSEKTYEGTTNVKGEASFLLPCDELFNVVISNYVGKIEIRSPAYPNSASTRTYSYSGNMVEEKKAFAMSDTQKKVLDRAMLSLPDTTITNGATMRQPRDLENYTTLEITLFGLENQYLVGEEIVFTGRKRNKSFKATTSAKGHVRIYLPKGDLYDVHFKYHDNYSIEEVEYSKGTSRVRIEITYMGTKEYLRRKKAEEKRMEEERKRAIKALAQANREYLGDKVVQAVLDRNDWNNKLLISDVSYEMLDYAMKLAAWYEANKKGDQNTHFVLYNNAEPVQKSKTGHAFHMVSPGYQELIDKINYVHNNADMAGATDDLENLIVGGGIDKTYDDVILFVDKDASLRDYEYFTQLKAPVHVVLCVDDRCANAQHLTIAWKTKGSVHTFSGDYLNIGKLVEGDNFEMEGYTYRIMGGEFVLM